MLSALFTPARAAAWEHQQAQAAARTVYATLTRWVAALVFLLLLGTALGKLHPGPLALPDPSESTPYAQQRATGGTVLVWGDGTEEGGAGE